MNVLKLPCQGASRSVTSLPPKKQHMRESGPTCQVAEQEWQGSLKNGSAPPASPHQGSGARTAPRLSHRLPSATTGDGHLRKPSPASTRSLRGLFLLPISYHLLGKGKNKSEYTTKGHHGEIQNQSAFKVSTSKSILDPEAIRTCSLGSSKELVAVHLALACRDGQWAKRKGTKKRFGLSHVPFLLTLKRKIKLK